MILELYNLSYKIKDLVIFNGVNLKFDQPGLVLIKGPSGSGKSTLIHLIGGLLSPSSGEIIIEGKSLQNPKNKINHSISYIFQGYHLIEQLTVYDNLFLLGFSDFQIKEALNKVELLDYIDSLVSNLSGGQKQRVAIARIYLIRPKIILADEPTSALDMNTSKLIKELLLELSELSLVFVISHELDLFDSVCKVRLDIENCQIKSTYMSAQLPKLISFRVQQSIGLKQMWRYIRLSLMSKKGRLFITMISQIFSIVLLIILFSCSGAIERKINTTIQQQLDVNRVSIIKNSDQGKFNNEDINKFKNLIYTNYVEFEIIPQFVFESNFNITTTQLPKNKNINILGKYPENNLEVVINKSLSKHYNIDINDKIQLEDNRELLVTGICQELNDLPTLYFDQNLLSDIEQEINYSLVYIETDYSNLGMIVELINKDLQYQAYNETLGLINNFNEMKIMIYGALEIFLIISLMTNILMTYLMYYASLIQKRKEIITLFLYGYSKAKIYLICYYEMLIYSLLCIVFGVLVGWSTIPLLNNIIGITVGQEWVNFLKMPFHETLIEGIHIHFFPYIIISLNVILTLIISISLSIKQLFKMNIVSILKGDELC